MRYTVVWDNAALDDLANLWTGASDRAAVQAAADQIDRELTVNPNSKGAAFYGDRLLVIPPLSIVFTVSDDDRKVTVRNIW